MAGGFESADGMHGSGVGYALLASKVMNALGLAHNEEALLQKAFDEDKLLSVESRNLDALVGILGVIRRTQIDLGLDLTEAAASDQLGISSIVKLAQSVFKR